MKRPNKFFFGFMALIILTASFGMTAFAEEEPYTPYEESRGQVNFDNLELMVYSQNQVDLSVDESLGWLSKLSGKRELAKAEALLEEYPSIEEQMAQAALEGEGNLRAVGYAVAPLVEVDGHYERVKKENKLLNLLLAPFSIGASAKHQNGSNARPKESDYFVMFTTIWDKHDFSGQDYIARTYAHWTKNSALGGSKYPASGDDFILLAVPEAMIMKNERCQVKYGPYGNGSSNDYSRVTGGRNWVAFSIVDDPLGPRQLTEVALDGYCDGGVTTAKRKINSYYVHTWKSLNITVGFNIGPGGTSLSITPGINNKSWQLYSYVVFNF